MQLTVVNFTSNYLDRWLTQLGDYRSKLALCELKVITLPKLFSRYNTSEDERLKDRQTIELLKEQFSIFNHYTSSLSVQQREALDGKYNKANKNVDPEYLKTGKKELCNIIKVMSKYDEIEATVTSGDYFVIRWKGAPLYEEPIICEKPLSPDRENKDFDPYSYWSDLMEVRRY